MADQFPQADSKSQDVRGAPGTGRPGQGATHGATATAVATSRGTRERTRTLAGALIEPWAWRSSARCSSYASSAACRSSRYGG